MSHLPKKLALLPFLSVLTLESCKRLTSEGCAPLANLNRVTKLTLSGCSQLTVEVLPHLKNMARLEQLFCHDIYGK